MYLPGSIFEEKIKTNLTPEGVKEINMKYMWYIKLGTYQSDTIYD